MRKTIKSTEPKAKRKYTRKSKLRTERTDVQDLLNRVTKLEQVWADQEKILQTKLGNLWNQREWALSSLVHRLDKTDHNIQAIFLRLKDLE